MICPLVHFVADATYYISSIWVDMCRHSLCLRVFFVFDFDVCSLTPIVIHLRE